MSRDTEVLELVERPDLRLAPAAMLSWLVALLGLYGGWRPAAVVVVCSAAVAASVVARPAIRSASGPAGHPRLSGAGAGSGAASGPGLLVRWRVGGRYRAGLLAAAGCVASVGLVITCQAYQLAGHPLRQLAARSAAVTVRVVLTADPSPVLSTGSSGYGGRPAGAVQVSVPAELVSAEAGGRRWHLGGRVLLLAPVQAWSGLLPGAELTASGVLVPATRPDLTVAVLRVRGPPSALSSPPWWQRGAGVLRDGLRRAASVLPPRAAQLLPGLVVGDTSTMSYSLREEFRTTGLTHLTAVSGSNLVIVVGAVFGLCVLCRAGPRLRTLVALLALVGFVILARPSPSVLRAAVMGGVGLLAVLSGRQRSAVPALAASVIGLLLADPALAADAGFVLSVLATAALVLLAPGWSARLRRLGCPPGVAEALAVPAAAHVVTAPVVAGLSGQFSLVAVVANVAAAPAVAPVTVLGVLAALISPLSPGLARLAVRVAGPGVGWLVAVAHWGAGIPDATLSWPSGLVGVVALSAVLVTGWLLLRRRRPRLLIMAALFGAAVVLVPTKLVIHPGWPAAGWAMVACDVGQGDALVLATGQPGVAVVVDTGTEAGNVDGCLARLGVRVVPLVVLTHMHADHIGGLDVALSGRTVGAIAVGPVRPPVWAFGMVRQIAARHYVPVVELRIGQQLSWPALMLRVLGPVAPSEYLDPEDGTDVNNTSVVMWARTGAGTVLLAGDAEVASQSAVLDSGAELRADILKMPHHGSRSSSPEFLAAVHPRLVLVSVGAGNPYGHPNAGVLEQLRRAGALIRRTDQSGDIAVVSSVAGPVAVARGDPLPAPRRALTQPPASAQRGGR